MASAEVFYNGDEMAVVTITGATIGEQYEVYSSLGSNVASPVTAESETFTITVLGISDSASAGDTFIVEVREIGTGVIIGATVFVVGFRTRAGEDPTEFVWTYDGVNTITVTGTFTLGDALTLYATGPFGFADNGLDGITGTGAPQTVTLDTTDSGPPAAGSSGAFEAGIYGAGYYSVRLFDPDVASSGRLGGGPLDDIIGRVLIAPATGPLTTEVEWKIVDHPDWPSLIARIDVNAGRQSEFDTTDTATATIDLNDRWGLFDPGNPTSPFADWDGCQILIRLRNPVTGVWYTQFRGTLEDPDFNFNPATFEGKSILANVRLTAVGIFEYLAGVEMVVGVFGEVPPPAPSVGAVVYEEGPVDERLTDLFDDASLDPLQYVVFSGNVDVQRTVYEAEESVLPALRDAGDAEFGGLIANLYEDKRGRAVFHGRKARFDPDDTADDAGPMAWTFTRWRAGDGAAITLDDERAQIREVGWSRPRTRIRNAGYAWPVGILDADKAAQYTIDTDSKDRFGYRPWKAPSLIIKEGTTTGNNANDECKLFTEFVVANYKDPRTRVERVTFKSLRPSDQRAAATWLLICAAEISDIVDLEHGYPGPDGVGVSEDFYIEGFHLEIAPLNPQFDMAVLNLNLSPQSYYGDDVGLLG